MFKRWKGLSELECVKEFGWRHKVEHFLYSHRTSKCVMVIGIMMNRGFLEGLEGRNKNES